MHFKVKSQTIFYKIVELLKHSRSYDKIAAIVQVAVFEFRKTRRIKDIERSLSIHKSMHL